MKIYAIKNKKVYGPFHEKDVSKVEETLQPDTIIGGYHLFCDIARQECKKKETPLLLNYLKHQGYHLPERIDLKSIHKLASHEMARSIDMISSEKVIETLKKVKESQAAKDLLQFSKKIGKEVVKMAKEKIEQELEKCKKNPESSVCKKLQNKLEQGAAGLKSLLAEKVAEQKQLGKLSAQEKALEKQLRIQQLKKQLEQSADKGSRRRHSRRKSRDGCGCAM